MHFLRRNQYLLLTVAVLVFASVMVLRQLIANQAAHVERREDFIALHEKGENQTCVQFYERLIQELPSLSDRTLVEDLQRTLMLVDPKAPDLDNPVWKYYVSVKKELQQRAEKRLENITRNQRQ